MALAVPAKPKRKGIDQFPQEEHKGGAPTEEAHGHRGLIPRGQRCLTAAAPLSFRD